MSLWKQFSRILEPYPPWLFTGNLDNFYSSHPWQRAFHLFVAPSIQLLTEYMLLGFQGILTHSFLFVFIWIWLLAWLNNVCFNFKLKITYHIFPYSRTQTNICVLRYTFYSYICSKLKHRLHCQVIATDSCYYYLFYVKSFQTHFYSHVWIWNIWLLDMLHNMYLCYTSFVLQL